MKAPFKLTLLWILFAWKGVFAQDNLPPVYELKTDTAAQYKLDGNYSQMLEDPADKYTIEQVASPAFNHRFHANETAKSGVNRKIRTYWFRFQVRNALGKDVTFYFDNPPYYHSQELYTPTSTRKWQKRLTGNLTRWSQRDGLKYAQKLPYTLQKGQQVIIYQRIQTFRSRVLELPPPSFRLKERFLEEFYTNTADREGIRSFLVNGIIMGIWLIAALFNFSIYLQLRERIYLYFCLWVFLYSCFHFRDYIQILVLREYSANFYWVIMPYLGYVTAIFQVLFIRSFLQTRRHLPNWDKALLVAISLNTLGGILFQILIKENLSLLDKLGPLLSLVYSITCLLIGLITIKMTRQGNSSARFLLIATIPGMLLIGIGNSIFEVYFLFTSRALIPVEFLRDCLEFSILWMVIIFSGALIGRYNQTRKELAEKALEKERLEREKEIERSQLIEAQKIELEKQVAERTAELKQSLEHLKATQVQLIQSEKMASLGELTAGIAHEIQNPLNFVNNFSEVNAELIAEIEQEIRRGNIEEVESLVNDIKENEQKIRHHGQRADSIVKGMLQHSRTSSGKKELTDINALAEEYLRLSYHGLRAKDKEFNAQLVTEFDKSLGKVEVVPQEIGRVLLNLFNNAFYATQQKKAQLNGQYQPEIQVSTRQENGKVEISVRDNGTGMPEGVKHKIFQPFFTTKPTGQGTGLGLSLSYDIITKGHGGELKVETKEGEYSQFLIIIPKS